MSVIPDVKLSWAEKFCIRVLKADAIPNHVAFIMDGNRRFAQKSNLVPLQGHQQGSETIMEVVHWCQELGIKEVTVYAFSIENFKRSNVEVNGLMTIFLKKFIGLLEEKDKLIKKGMCIRILGNLALLPKDLQKVMAELELLTHNHSRFIFNICVSYGSREEMCHAVQELSLGVEKGLIMPEDITEELFQKCLYTSSSSEPDLVIRTSGEVRLSDFLLWQSAYSVLAFANCFWPGFAIWRLFFAVIIYQLNCAKAKECKALAETKRDQALKEHVRQCAQDELCKTRSVSFCGKNLADSDKEVEDYMKNREERIERFLEYISKKKFHFLKKRSEGECECAFNEM